MPVYDHLTYDIVPGARDRGEPARRAHRRGPQRPPARPADRRGHVEPGGQRLLRLLDLRRRPHERRPPLVRRPVPRAARRPRSRGPSRTSTGTPRSPTTRPWNAPSGSGTRSTQPNLVQNILPTRSRATLVLTKDSDHAVRAGPAAQAVALDAAQSAPPGSRAGPGTARCPSPRARPGRSTRPPAGEPHRSVGHIGRSARPSASTSQRDGAATVRAVLHVPPRCGGRPAQRRDERLEVALAMAGRQRDPRPGRVLQGAVRRRRRRR